ncbi:MAG: M1 family aminopeptidase, partial [Pseudomonadota bacterium]
MREAEPKAIHLEDYRSPDYRTRETDLTFDIRDGETVVTSRLRVERADGAPSDAPLILDGRDLALESVAVNGATVNSNQYQVDDRSLTLFDVPEAAEIEVVTRIHPEQNTALEGLYKSGGMYCTQCEAEGFRRITYYQDRPDVLSKFTTTVIADAERYPMLLSNGNLVDQRASGDGRHQATWADPFPKPSYLFALVAGDLAVMEDCFVTVSGREVTLRIYSEPHNIEQCRYAMDVLKRAMRWDEEAFGREYDLDVFMVVAVEDFNMGAMENKGLNIFNTSCVLASPDTATDAAYQRVEAVVAHEYFHNWSGNRVTCRDWFQLSLKEGFTVFRDAEFSSDMNSRTQKRIEDVTRLRSIQFAEDAGPLAHPVRPDSY